MGWIGLTTLALAAATFACGSNGTEAPAATGPTVSSTNPVSAATGVALTVTQPAQ